MIFQIDVKVSESRPGMHLAYCDRIYKCDRDFPDNGKINVLVQGNSWARDWANVLWESSISNRINLSYSFPRTNVAKKNFLRRIKTADVIFIQSTHTPSELIGKNVYHIGYKYFGPSNGFAYSRRFFNGYYDLSVKPPEEIIKKNEEDKEKCGDRIIDIIGALQNDDGRVPVFSDENKMISHDCYHLTQGGARYIAKKMQRNIETTVLGEKGVQNENTK